MAASAAERALHRFFRGFVVWRHGVFPERHAQALARFEALPAAAKREAAFERLVQVVRRAHERVPYYRRRFAEHGVAPADLSSPSDLARFPILEKRDVIAHREALCAEGADTGPARWDATGGSTGEPLRFVKSRAAEAITYANEARTWRWYGVPPGARQAYLWGADRDVPPDLAVSNWRSRLLGVCQLNAFLVDDRRSEQFADILDAFQPAVVYGYATALARFATWLLEHGRRLPSAPRAVRSTAEVLLPEHRDRIAEAFGAPVLDYYGSREAGPIAAEAPGREGLHVFSDVTHVEVVDADDRPCPPGVVGDLVVTKLHENDMPFVRYRIGDRAAWLPDEDPEFGLPRLTPLEGRVGDFVLGPDGRAIHGEFFTHLFYGVAGIHRFQVRQPDPARLEVLVEGEDVSAVELERIRAASADRFGGEVTIATVPEIRPGPSGKHRFVIPYVGDATP